jgi:AMMECR1 domain-containing protein
MSAGRRRVAVRTSVAAIALAVAALASGSFAAADALAPYRALPGSPRGRALLATARAAIARHFDSTAAADTLDFDWPGEPCGMYVSLVRGASTTRACVGSLVPLGGTLGESVERLAALAVASDGRRPPLRREELAELRVVVAFATPGEPVDDPMRVRPMRQGLLVRTPRGDVAFLPGEARTVSWALREARRAGVLGRLEEASFQRFDAVVLAESAPPEPEGEHVAR